MIQTITINAPQNLKVDMKAWEARYQITTGADVFHINIESRSAIEIVVAKLTNLWGYLGNTIYYISSPNFGVAIPSISTLTETWWITDKLMSNGMSAPDAVTIAYVLRDIGDF